MINESDVLPPAAAWMTPRKSRILSPRRSIAPEDRIYILFYQNSWSSSTNSRFRNEKMIIFSFCD